MFSVYSTGCPKCKVLMAKLQKKNMIPGKDFELVEDDAEILKVAREYGIQAAPFLVDSEGKAYLFSEAVKFVNRLGD